MPSPPILRLSQALYSSVPSPPRASSPARSSSRKREHGQVAASGCDSSSVRLLLPKAFDVADRAYHARHQCSKAAAAKGDEVGHAEVRLVTYPCCSDDSEAEKRLLSVTATATGRIASDSGNSSTCDTLAYSTARDCGKDSQQQRFDPVAAAEVVTARGGGGTEMVVVESVLGFSALHSLLERSLATAPQSLEDHHDLNGPSGGVAGAADGCNGEADGTRGGERSDPGVSETVGRLVGWLRTLRASTVLLEGQEDNDDISYHRHLIVSSTSGSGRKQASPLEGEAAAAVPPSTRAPTDDLSYQVTKRCEVGSEWSAFTLEPAATQAQEASGGPLSGIQFEDGGGDGGGGSGGCSTGRTLEIRLICHPLVTMVPDIRWCLRLIGQAKATAGLMNANAKLSTLGGGYFLTRQVGQAINLARTQSEVAMALGDVQLAGKCRINEAYNYIWMGRYIEARRIIRTQVLASRAVHDEELENVATIASRFLRRSKKANRRLMETQMIAGGGGGSGGNCQEWMRQKIDVKTDEWHRVRALPMYCSSGSGRVVSAGWGRMQAESGKS